MTRVYLYLLFIVSIGLSCSFTAMALVDDKIVQIRQVSTSGKSIVIDRGNGDDIVLNDFGILLAKARHNKTGKTVFKPVARLKAIKTYNRSSIWVIFKEFIPKLVVKNKKFLLLSKSALLKGRSKLSYKRSKLVTSKKPKKEVTDFMLEGDDLAQLKDNYREIEEPHKKEQHFEKDIELIDVDQWGDRLGDGKMYMDGIYKSPYAKDFSERKRVQTFEKMVYAFLNKYNNPSYSHEEMYADQKRDNSGHLPKNSNNASVHAQYIKRQYNKEEKREKFYREVLKKGDTWSDNYSDAELSEILNDIGVIKERERRKTLFAYKYEYQMFGSFNLNLIDNENGNDTQNTQNNKFDLEVSVESYLFKKYKSFNRFSLEGSFRRAQDGYYGGSLNVISTEYSVAGHLNWYPYADPNTVQTNIVYFGVHIRYGLARLTIDSTVEEGNYQVISIPGLRAGLKYNFTNAYGMRATFTFENIRSERLVKSADQGNLPDRTDYIDGKIGIGISKYF